MPSAARSSSNAECGVAWQCVFSVGVQRGAARRGSVEKQQGELSVGV